MPTATIATSPDRDLGTIQSVPELIDGAPYKQMAQHYRDAIRNGRLNPGDVMPTTQELAAEYKVAMSTAARALALLRDEGWIQTRPSKPAVVAANHPDRKS